MALGGAQNIGVTLTFYLCFHSLSLACLGRVTIVHLSSRRIFTGLLAEHMLRVSSARGITSSLSPPHQQNVMVLNVVLGYLAKYSKTTKYSKYIKTNGLGQDHWSWPSRVGGLGQDHWS
ncbi:hypothetical protein BD311DRAFT_843153 [Dichomitus squalens]|uniref:Uncharacterized protein n=1 Tax=Dichomitus squalens TaxID=114155 RepID=A0A4Q9MJL1_9APHY|nr:hypothetical protein BD311DRAFT_843153 [Dichomitus squalens]